MDLMKNIVVGVIVVFIVGLFIITQIINHRNNKNEEEKKPHK